MNRKEALVTAAVVAAFIVFGVVAVKMSRSAGSGPAAASQVAGVPAGTHLAVPGVDWAAGDRTLLLVLSKGCHYCEASAPFYRRLAIKAGQQARREGGDKVQLVAVVPQDVAVGRQYLVELGVPVERVASVPLATLGVPGTPTLILVDKGGAVVDSWVGQLPPDGEIEVTEHLLPKTAA